MLPCSVINDTAVKTNKVYLLFLALGALWACENMAYDVSGGVDSEITLFSDQVSLPIADIGPLTPKQLLGEDSDILDALSDYVTEDEDGYLVVENKGASEEQYVIMLASTLSNPLIPNDVSFADFSGTMEDKASVLNTFGFSLSPQLFTLTAANPLTEDIAVSGKMSLLSLADADNPSETLLSQEFTKVTVPSGSKEAEIFHIERSDWRPLSGYKLENLFLHLPASILEKDPASGFGSFSFAYHYKSYLSLGSDFPLSIPAEIKDLNLQLAQYRVKEAKICTEVSNEIPITLVLDSVDVYVDETDADGNVSTVITDKVSVSPGLTISAGCTSNPKISPLEIIIKADDGTTIPDISALTLNLSIKAPVGVADPRIGLNQRVYFNNLRATVSGGITIQSL